MLRKVAAVGFALIVVVLYLLRDTQRKDVRSRRVQFARPQQRNELPGDLHAEIDVLRTRVRMLELRLHAQTTAPALQPPPPSPPSPASSPPPSPRSVYVVTFSDRPDNLYLHVLAACVWHFNRKPLYVLGLSGLRSPNVTSGRWHAVRMGSIKGTDYGKQKKLFFLGALLEQRPSPLVGMRPTDLLLFVDAFDVLIQRPLATMGASLSLIHI